MVSRDVATGTDTSTMPAVAVGNVAYTGAGPLKYVNRELAGIHLECPGLDIVVENGASVFVPQGSTCNITPALVNTGSAAWLPTTHSAGGVVLRTSQADLPLRSPVESLQTGESESLPVNGRAS